MSDQSEDAFEQLLRRVARTPEVTAVRRSVAPGSLLVDRFAVERQLGEGGMGRVFAAFDQTLQSHVALKILGTLTPRSITAIKREFRAAAELAHPNLVRLHELFFDGVECFFSMDLVSGASLSSVLRDNLTVGQPLLESLFRQLAVALRALHAAGVLHGDLKPSNFLVTHADQRIVLLDFGLARPLGVSLRDHRFAGTPEYMAPEQARGQDLNEAADWYSYGVVLFETLTGRLPSQCTPEQELRVAPPHLQKLCLALLQQDPSARPSGEAVLEQLGGAHEGQPLASVPPISRGTLLGREQELDQLSAQYEHTLGGGNAVVLVHGPPGIGKSSLLEHFLAHVRASGATVLAGRCREREAVGYKAIDGLIDDLVTLLDSFGEREAAQMLPADLDELTRLFPALRVARVIGANPKRKYDIPDQTIAKRRAISAFGELLGRLSERAPLVVWLDDLQWSDAESALLIEPLISDLGAGRILLIGSYRTNSGRTGPLLEALFATGRALPQPSTLELAPLSSEQARLLALQLLPKTQIGAEALARSIARDAGGNPLFICELAHFSGFSSSHAPSTLTELVSTRLGALSVSARELLETIAIAGAPLPRAAARLALGLAPLELEHCLGSLRANRLSGTLRVGDEDRIDVLHDRIREIIVQSIDPAAKRAQHLALARALGADPNSEPHVLATHYQAGGELVEAGRHWIAAGEQADRTLAFAQAADFYALGASQAALDPSALHALELRRAESLAAAGKGALAADAYLASAERSMGAEALELQRRAAEQLLLSGHLDRGLTVIEQVLRTLGMRRTRTGHRGFLSILAGRLRVRARGLSYRQRAASEIPEKELARVDASWSIACSLGVTDFVRGADFQNDHLLLALNAGEPRRLLRALTLEISYGATPGVGSERRTETLLGLADTLVKGMNDDNAVALAQVSRGIAAYLQGRVGASLQSCEEAVNLLRQRCTGAVWETVTAQRFMIASLFLLGRFRDLATLVPPFVAEAEIQGNLYAASYFRTSYSNTAWLVRDDTAEAQRQLARARGEWTAQGTQLPHCWLLVGQTNLGFYNGDAEGTWARLCERWPDLQAAHFFHVGVLRVQLWYLRSASAALLAQQLAQKGQRARAADLWLECRRAAEQLAREPIASAAPLAGLLLASADRGARNLEHARNRLNESARQLDQLGFRLYAAAARARLAELSTGPTADSLRAAAAAVLQQEAVQNMPRMLDLLAPGFGLFQ